MELIQPVTFRSKEEQIYRLNDISYIKQVRPTLTEIHLADLHFGALDPKYQYDTLTTQVLDKLEPINFDIFSINGDIFDHKFMSNSDPIMYALMFMDKVVDLCRRKNATLILLAGTASHDAQQLKLFYHYLEDPSIDIRIVESVRFEYVKGAKILCVPELYGMGEAYYNQFLFTEPYDAAIVHGTIVGSIYGASKEDLDSSKYPVFSIDSFANCTGPIISGHVHTPGCFEGYYYYCGSPYRWVFGQEEEKGFLICLHNLETQWHYMHFQPIECLRYDTINMDYYISRDPKELIAHVKQLQASGIHNIRLEFTKYNKELLDLLSSYYRNDGSIKIKAPDQKIEMTEEINRQIEEKYTDYQYIFDPELSGHQIITQYINQQKGYQYITTEELIKLLEDV
jgi:hypothetical protein